MLILNIYACYLEHCINKLSWHRDVHYITLLFKKQQNFCTYYINISLLFPGANKSSLFQQASACLNPHSYRQQSHPHLFYRMAQDVIIVIKT